MQPWFSHSCFGSIVAELTNVIHQYVSFLTAENEKSKAHHSATSTKHAEDNATPVTLPAKAGPILECYESLYQHLCQLELINQSFLMKSLQVKGMPADTD